MKLLNLRILNCLSIRDAHLTFDDKGLVAIKGENKDGTGADSNGSGKSSIFEAIFWCAFGETTKDISSDEIINSEAGKDCAVESTWLDEVTGIEYQINRYRKHKTYKDQSRFLVKHPSGPWEDRTKGKNSLTQSLIENALGMDKTVFKAACYASGEDCLDIPGMTDKELKELLEGALPFAKIEPVFLHYKTELANKKSDLAKKEQEYYKLEATYDANEQLLHGANEEAKVHEDNRYKRALAIDDVIQSKEENIEKTKDSIVDVSKVKAAIKVTESQLNFLTGANAIYQQITFSLEEKESDLFSSEIVLEQTKATVRRHVVINCPTCRQEMPTVISEQYITDLQKKIDKTSSEISLLKEEAALKLKDAEKEKALNEKLHKLRHIFEGNKFHETTVNSLRNDIKLLKEQKKTLEVNPYLANIDSLEKSMDGLQVKMDNLMKEMEALKPDIRIYEHIVEALGPKGFRYHLLETATPCLNNRTNYYLSLLTDGTIGAIWSTVEKNSTGEYKEKFSIRVSMDGRTRFGSLSGGQKRKVRLACFFALQDLIAERAEKDCSLYLLDEVDNALDPAGLERLMSLLEEKARQKGTVVVISHNPTISDWVCNTAIVTMENKESKVNGFLNV